MVFALLGLAVGSFLNVCIDRLPANKSIVLPPSHCEACQHKLSPEDLIPLFSYLRLRGRCRYCQAAIPRRLFWVELAAGTVFALLFWHYGFSTTLGAMLFYACLFIVVFVIDLAGGLLRGHFPHASQAPVNDMSMPTKRASVGTILSPSI